MKIDFEEKRLDRLFSEVKTKIPLTETELLTPSTVYGVVPQSSLPSRPHQVIRDDYMVHPAKLGDFVISMSSFQHGFEYCSISGGISPDYTLLRPNFEKAIGRFLKYSLKSNFLIQQLTIFRNGIRQGQRLQWNRVRYVKIPVPNLQDAKNVADFLDRETTRIDQLIEKKQQLVALLKECRSARITAAVTGQTDATSHAKSGTSAKGGGGVSMMRLRHMATITNSNVDKVTADDEASVRLCNYVDVYKNDRITAGMDFMSASATPTEIAKFKLEVGDVIITKDSEDRNDIAVPAYVSETASNLVCGYHLALLRAYPKVAHGDFLFWALQTKQVREAFSNAAGGVTRFGLTLDGMKSVAVSSPNLKTQKTIADYLDRETIRIDTLVEKTEQSINRLKEHRAALITAAVTGQLDMTT